MINLTHGAFRGVFKNWGFILISRKSPVFACNQLINRFNTHFRSSKRFQKWGLILISWKLIFLYNGPNHYIQFSILILNPQSSISEKWSRSEKNASLAPLKLIFEAQIIFFSYQTYEPSVFCKKKLHSIWSNMAATVQPMIYIRIWVRFCRTGKMSVLCPIFFKSRAFVWLNLIR